MTEPGRGALSQHDHAVCIVASGNQFPDKSAGLVDLLGGQAVDTQRMAQPFNRFVRLALFAQSLALLE